MRLLILLFLILGLSFTHPQQNASLNKEKDVYVCVSSTAYAYHQKRHCRGLDACTHEIKKIKENEAIAEYRRKACKVCH